MTTETEDYTSEAKSALRLTLALEAIASFDEESAPESVRQILTETREENEEIELDFIECLNAWALSVEVTYRVSLGDEPSRADITEYVIVWGTGGPHYQTRLRGNGEGIAEAWGWFGKGEASIPVYNCQTLVELLDEWAIA